LKDNGDASKVESTGAFRRILSLIGPAFITASVVLGPGSITVSTKCGATMGYSALWVVVAAGIMMITYTHMGAKIGMSSDASLLTVTTRKYGRWVAVLIGICGFLITSGFQTGNNCGVGIAFSEMFGGPQWTWAVVFTLISLVVLWTSSNIYKVLEKVMIVMVAMMIVAFFGNLSMIRPSGIGILKGLVPSKPAVFPLLVAISATTFSVAAAAFQPYLVKAKGWSAEDVRKGLKDSAVGISTLVTISCVIMITSAAVLRSAGVKVDSAADMAEQLKPMLGSLARWFFLWGLWAGAFSSFVVNALVGGTLMADGLGIGDSIDSFWSKLLATGVMGLGAALAVLFGKNPVQLIVVAQATTILGVPLMAVVMILLANDKELMGEARNRLLANVIAIAAIIWLLALSIRQGLATATLIRNALSAFAVM